MKKFLIGTGVVVVLFGALMVVIIIANQSSS